MHKMTNLLLKAVLCSIVIVIASASTPITRIENLFNANGRPAPFLSGRNLFGTTNNAHNRFPVIRVNGQNDNVSTGPATHGRTWVSSIPVVDSGVNVPADFYGERKLTKVDIDIPWGAKSNPPLPSSSGNSPSVGPSSSIDEIFTVVDGIKEFSLDILGKLRKPNFSGKNIVFSPVSITSLLSLFTLATRGETKAQIENALWIPDMSVNSAQHAHAQFETILKRLNHASKGLTIKTSNRLFVARDIQLLQNFTKQAAEHYNCSSIRLDFMTDLFVKDKINNWVEQETFSLIKKILTKPPLKTTRLIAINTIYFKGDWKIPFAPAFTMDRNFDTGKEMVKHPFMINLIEVLYFSSEKLNLDIVALPYEGDEYSMFIIVPKESPQIRSIESVEIQLDNFIIEELIDSMVLRNVSVAMPKMRLNMKEYLNQPLSELEIVRMFSPLGDFSGMTNSKLRVNSFIHEAVMQIDEKGTVAAAVSGALLDRRGPEFRIQVNKPSILFIREHASGLPLFWARLVKPEKLM